MLITLEKLFAHKKGRAVGYQKAIFRYSIIITLFTCIILNNFNNVKAETSVTDLKGMATVFQPGFGFLSPIHGAVLWKKGYVENLYRFGPDSATVKLTEELFHLHHDGVTFDRTYHPLKPGAYFKVETIGKVICAIVRFLHGISVKKQLEESEEYQELRKQIKGASQEDKQKLQAQIRTLRSKGGIQTESFLKNQFEQTLTAIFKGLGFEAGSKKINEFYGRVIKRIEDDRDVLIGKIKQEGISEEERRKLEEKIEAHNRSLEKNRGIKEQKQKHQSFYDGNVRETVSLILISIGEEGSLYVPNHTIYLLLAFLWKISDDKEAFFQYFTTLRGELGSGINLFNQEKLNQFKDLTFSKEEYISLTKLPAEELVKADADSFEKLVFINLGFNIFENSLPPEIKMRGGVQYKTTVFPDCGETSLLNFFNAIFFDSEGRKFNVGKFEILGSHQKVIDFYRNYQTVQTMKDTQKLHNQWAEVVSGWDGVNYARAERCEINTSTGGFPRSPGNAIKNVLHLIQKLLNLKEEDVGSFEELMKTLKEKATIDIKYLSTEPYGEGKVVKFATKGNVLNWIFYSRHFELNLPKAQQSSNVDLKRELEAKAGLFVGNSYDKTKYSMLVGIYDLSTLGLLKDFSYEFYTIILSKFRELELLRKIAENQIFKSVKNSIKESIIKKLYLNVPATDEYSQRRALEAIFGSDLNAFNILGKEGQNIGRKDVACQVILERKIEGWYEWVNKTLPTIENDYKVSVIKSIIESKNDGFYLYVNEVLPTIKSDFYKSSVMKSIISFKNERFYWYVNEMLTYYGKIDVIEEVISHKIEGLYEVANKVLLSIKEDLRKINAIKEIISNKIEGLYEGVNKALPLIENNSVKARQIRKIITEKIDGLYEGAKQALSTIQDRHSYEKIIELIRSYKREELYEFTGEPGQQRIGPRKRLLW